MNLILLNFEYFVSGEICPNLNRNMEALCKQSGLYYRAKEFIKCQECLIKALQEIEKMKSKNQTILKLQKRLENNLIVVQEKLKSNGMDSKTSSRMKDHVDYPTTRSSALELFNTALAAYRSNRLEMVLNVTSSGYIDGTNHQLNHDPRLVLKLLFLGFDAAIGLGTSSSSSRCLKIIERIENLLNWSFNYTVFDSLIPHTMESRRFLMNALHTRMDQGNAIEHPLALLSLPPALDSRQILDNMMYAINTFISSLNIKITLESPLKCIEHLLQFQKNIKKLEMSNECLVYIYQAAINVQLTRLNAAKVFLDRAKSTRDLLSPESYEWKLISDAIKHMDVRLSQDML